jgi:hypothetical protein
MIDGRARLRERLLVAEAGELAQHVVEGDQRESEREAAEREAEELQRQALVVTLLLRRVCHAVRLSPRTSR